MTSVRQQAFAVVYYSVSSIVMTLVNKAAVKALPHPWWLCLVQNAATLGLALPVAYFVAPRLPSVPKLGRKVALTRSVAQRWMPALLLFVLMLISSLSAMEYLTVPSVLVFRALTPLVTAGISIPVLGGAPTVHEWAALALIVVGALCYLVSDPSFSLLGYAWMSANLVSAAAYHVYVKRIINDLQPTTMDMVVWNNLLSLPLLLLLGILLDQPSDALHALTSLTPAGAAAVLVSVVVASQIAYSGFLLQALVHPTSATLVNHAIKVASFVASYAIFHDRLGVLMAIGAGLTLVGTVWYSRASMMGASGSTGGGGGGGGGFAGSIGLAPAKGVGGDSEGRQPGLWSAFLAFAVKGEAGPWPTESTGLMHGRQTAAAEIEKRLVLAGVPIKG